MVQCCTIPVRLVVGILIFFGSFVSYMIRAHMSILIINISAPLKFTIQNDPSCPNGSILYQHRMFPSNEGGWKPINPVMVGTVFSAYSWGYSFSILPAQILAQKWGAARLVGYTTLVAAGLTALSPVGYHLGVSIFIALRFLVGVLSGFVFPLLHILIIKWSPMHERSAFGAAFYGTSVGIIVTYIVSACVLKHWSWSWIAYVSGLTAMVWSIVWLAFATDTPAEHAFISEVEIATIQFRRISAHVRRAPKSIPWKKIVYSRPMQALFILLWGNAWNLTFYLDYMPIFCHEVLNYDIVTASMLAGLPILTRMVFSWMCIPVAKNILRRNYLSISVTRKSFTVVSHILPGLMQLTLVCLICNKTITTIELVLFLGLNGAIIGGGLANAVDLTPHFAGTVYNSMQALLSLTGICMPYVVGVILLYSHNRVKGWIVILSLNAGMYLFGGIIFLIFGSSTVQPWDVSTLRGSVMINIHGGDESEEDYF